MERSTYTIDEAAKILGCSRNLAYTLARQGRFPGVIKLGDKRMVISKKAIAQELEAKGQVQNGRT